MAKTYNVVVTRVGEGEHQPERETFDALSAAVNEDGSVSVKTETGGATFGPTTWGSVTIMRVAGR